MPAEVAESDPTSPASAPSSEGSGGLGPRTLGAIVLGGSGTVLGIAAGLDPVDRGIGTHVQLGMPECGWIVAMDLPCPTCGMTTAFSFAADGNLLASATAQPLGAILAVGTAMAAVGGAWTLATGSRAFGRLASMWWTSRTGWIAGAAVLVAWAYKMAAHRGLI